MKKIISISLLVFVIIKLPAQSFIGIKDQNKPAPVERVVDFLKIKIEPEFDTKTGTIAGKVTHTFKALRPYVDSIFLHGVNMKYEDVKVSNRNARIVASDTGIIVYPLKPIRVGDIDSIVILYTCQPQKGIYFIGWNDPTQRNRKQIWTQGEGEDNRHWIPMYDKPNDKLITEMIVSFDSTYKVLSNGKLIEKTNKKEKTRWHYRMTYPHSGYLIMLGIGNYEIETRYTKRRIPVDLYYYPDQKDRVKPTYLHSTECIDFMEKQTGVPFPWEQYSNIPVQDFMYGAMENTTATIFGDFLLVDERAFNDRNYIGVNVHELTHQWFGDLVTNRQWDHIWLQESFATYYPKLYQKQIYGEDHYEWMRRSEQNASLSAGARNNLPIVHMNSGTERVYSKGSAVLDMLNKVYGEEAYQATINYYLNKHAYTNVETNDLIQAFQDTMGISPFWFFDQWIYHGGEPEYQVSYQEVMKESLFETQVTVKQIHQRNQDVGLFAMPIDIAIYFKDKAPEVHTVWVRNETETFSFANKGNKTIDFVLFDPGSWVLKKVKFEKSTEELISQATKAKNMIDRYDALVALRSANPERKRQLLKDRYKIEKHQSILSEIVSQLCKDIDPETKDFVKQAFEHKEAEVRAAAINNVNDGKFYLTQLEKALNDNSYNNTQAALEKLADINPDLLNLYLKQTENANGIGNKLKVKRLELMTRLPERSQKAYLDLVDLSSPSFEFQTRRNAAEALKRLNYIDENFIKHSTEAAFSFNTRLSGPVKSVIQYFCGNTAYKKQYQSYWKNNTWTPSQQTVIDALLSY